MGYKVIFPIAITLIGVGVSVLVFAHPMAGWLILGLGIGMLVVCVWYEGFEKQIWQTQGKNTRRTPLKLDEERIGLYTNLIIEESLIEGLHIDLLEARKRAVAIWKQEHGIEGDAGSEDIKLGDEECNK